MKKQTLALLSVATLLVSCGGAKPLSVEELEQVVLATNETVSSDAWVAPDALSISLTAHYEELYENIDGMDDFVSTEVTKMEYDCATGYYHIVSEVDSVVEQEMWSYPSGDKVISAVSKSGQKLYAEEACDSEAAALEKAALVSEEAKASNSSLAKGLDVLQTLKGFIEQHKVNNDEDPDNDIKNDYDVYDLKFEATGEAGSFDAKCNLDGSGLIDLGDGLVQQSTLTGVLDVSYKNGYLTKYVENATMLEVLPIDETTQMSMTIVVNQELLLSYKVTKNLPNLSEFQKVEQ